MKKKREKELASKKALQLLFKLAGKRKLILGLGSGTTIAIFVKLLGKSGLKNSLKIIPSSAQIEKKARKAGLKLVRKGKPAIAVDGADQINKKGEMLKGHGALAFVHEKELDYAAKKAIFVIDKSKISKLTKPVLIEVKANKLKKIKEKLRRFDCKIIKEIKHDKNKILFLQFKKIKNPKRLEQKLNKLGIIGNGIFACFKKRPIIVTN